MVRSRLHTVVWLTLLSAVLTLFFRETVFRGFSLVPTDMLHRLIAPYNDGVRNTDVQNHYEFDIVRLDYPWAHFWQDSMRRGEIPLWNPQVLGGHPLMAVSVHAVFNPFKILYLFLSTERAFSLGIVLGLWAAGVFMFAFLRELDRSYPAAFLGGIAYALNSQFVMWYLRAPNVFVWAPLVLLLVERSVRRSSWADAAGAGIAMGVAMDSGSIQAAAHLGFLCVGYLAGSITLNDRGRRAESVGRAGLVLIVAMLVYAVQLLPTLELMLREGTHRLQTVGTGQTNTFGRRLWGIPFLATFLFPGLAGSTESYSVASLFGGDMIDFNGYIGVVPCALFIVGALVVRERRVRWLLLISMGVLLLLFFTPLVRFLYHRFFVVMVFSMSVIAAYGWDALLDESVARSRRVRGAMIGLLVAGAMLIVGVLVAQWVIATHWSRLLELGQQYVTAHEKVQPYGTRQWRLDRVRLFLQHYRVTNVVFWLPAAILFGAVAAWWAYVRGALGRSSFAAVLILLTVLDLTLMGRMVVPQIDLQKFPLYPPLETISTVQKDHGLFRVQKWAPDSPSFLTESILSAYGLSTISGSDSLAPENLSILPYCRHGEWTPIADLVNIKYVLVPDGVDLPQDHFTFLEQAQGVRLYRNNRCRPRLQFLSDWKVIPNHDDVLEAMSAPTFDPTRMLIEMDPPQGFRGPATGREISGTDTTVELEQYGWRRVRGHVHCSHAGAVLLSDTYYPGWHATVDGVPAPIYRADYVLRAVFVTPGEHEVEFRYEPLSFRLGAAMSGVTVIVVAVAWLVSKMWRPRSGASVL
ncbi:MAG TPA: YfhO family protein [Verrucomicrobiae bacterium]|nr:YfhO family protein [Verrucomicrobiae bacterium]